MGMKPAIIREPVIAWDNLTGEVSTRTTITAFIEGDLYSDVDFLVDVLNEYKGHNVQIVIESLGKPIEESGP